MTKEEAYDQKMTGSSLSPLIFSLGLPTVIGMLVTSFYNLADTYFVSNLGASQSGAISVIFSLMSIIQAIGFSLGMGCGGLISRRLGEKKDEEAKAYGSSAFAAALFCGLFLTVVCGIFCKQTVLLIGAKGEIIPYAIQYGRIILYGAPIMCASYVLNNILRSQAKTLSSMIGLSCGGFLNIILDYLFIRVFHLGIAGAAWATIIGQCFSFLILLFLVQKKSSIVRLNIKNVSLKIITYFEIIKIGLPTFFRQGMASFSTAILNHIAGSLSDVPSINEALIAATGIANKIYMLIRSVVIGFGQGYQPIVGYNYGAKKFDRVKKAFWLVTLYCTVFCILSAGSLIPFCESIVRFFIEDSDPVKEQYVIEIGSRSLFLLSLTLPFLGYTTIANQTLQVLGKSGSATFLASCRQGTFYIPLILILPRLFHILGVQMTQPLADLFTFLVTIPFFIHFLKSMKKEVK